MTDAILQWLLQGDLLQFIIACYTERIGQAFFGIVILFFSVVFYNRTKSLMFVSVIWILLGGAFTAMFWIFSPLAVLMIILGITGVAYQLFDKESG